MMPIFSINQHNNVVDLHRPVFICNPEQSAKWIGCEPWEVRRQLEIQIEEEGLFRCIGDDGTPSDVYVILVLGDWETLYPSDHRYSAAVRAVTTRNVLSKIAIAGAYGKGVVNDIGLVIQDEESDDETTSDNARRSEEPQEGSEDRES